MIIILALLLITEGSGQQITKNGSEKQITFGGGPDNRPAWSPDGQNIAFHSPRGGNAFNIWVVPAKGGQLKRLTHTSKDENYPVWSPDGGKIAFIRYVGPATQGRGNIVVMAPDGTNQNELTNDGTIKTDVKWHPDGKNLIYSEGRGDKATFETDVWILNIENKNRIKLIEGYKERTKKGLAIGNIAIDSKGDRLAFSAIPETSSKVFWLYVMDIKVKKPVPIVTDMDRPWFPDWSPDGKWIAFHAGKMGSGGIWIVRPDGSERTKLIQSGIGDRFPSWSPDGKRIAFTRGTYEKGNIFIFEFHTTL